MKNRRATLGYAAPFGVFIGMMALERALRLPVEIGYPLRAAAAAIALAVFSREYIRLRPSAPVASIGVGLAVFAIWIGPDLVFHYRHFWLFENALTGAAGTAPGEGLKHNYAFLAVRIAGSALIVPVIEELFWRGWLMRWIINADFLKVPLGSYAAGAFWITAILFASEHGAYWEVGLAAGVVYNWWLIRTKNLADCILAHAVTNGVLAVWVLMGHWEYWV